jgi:hypothetical protein
MLRLGGCARGRGQCKRSPAEMTAASAPVCSSLPLSPIATRLEPAMFADAAHNVFASSRFYYLPFISRPRKGATREIASNIRMARLRRDRARRS